MPRRSRPGLGSVVNLSSSSTNRTWFTIVDAAEDSDTTEVYLHDEIGGWGVYSTDFIRELMGVTTPRVKLNINSPGGDVFEGFAIHNALKSHPAQIDTYTGGLAASAASIVFQAGDTRTMGKYATQMIHNPSAGVYGEAKDMRGMADLLDKLRDTLAAVYVDRTQQEVDAVVEMMAAETWFNAQEALDLGFADEVDDMSNDEESVKNRTRWSNLKNVYRYGSREEAPAPVRRARAKAANGGLIRNAPTPTSAPAPERVVVGPTEPVPVAEFVVDPDVFKAALRIAADPPVDTATAPFQWDPDVFKAVLKDKAEHAPAVAVAKAAEPELEFKDLFDSTLFTQAVIEGISK